MEFDKAEFDILIDALTRMSNTFNRYMRAGNEKSGEAFWETHRLLVRIQKEASK